MHIFDCGVAISWGMIDSKKSQVLNMVQEHVSETRLRKDTKRFHFKITENASVSIIDDTITLPDNKTMTLLAVSHALAQSSKLGKFKVMAERTIKDSDYLSHSLAKTGGIPLSRKSCRCYEEHCLVPRVTFYCTLIYWIHLNFSGNTQSKSKISYGK
jgi:uncharacterized Rmd1/YagE family protein